jgi:hypothetical protein
MPYEKTSDEVRYFTRHLPANATRKVRIYHYLNRLEKIPKCEFTGEDCWFSNSGYHGVNRYLFENLVAYDSSIKVEPLKYINLLRSGASPDELIRLREEKYFHKFRKAFSSCHTVEDVIERLRSDGFSEKSISELVYNLDFSEWAKIKSFIDRYYALTNGVKNNHARFYEIRGHSSHEAKLMLGEAMNTWEKFKHKAEDQIWYEMWCQSRSAGLLAQAGRSSKHEIALVESLSKKFRVKSHISISLKDVELDCRKFLKNKSRCYPDITFEDIIVEFHGSYWHHDFVAYPSQFTREDYVNEIVKLKCIQAASGKRVFVVWESDMKKLTLKVIVDMIEKFVAESSKIFGSTRISDIEIFHELL